MSNDEKPQKGMDGELLDVDMEEFEFLIDKSIDNLFVAADSGARPACSAGASDDNIQVSEESTLLSEPDDGPGIAEASVAAAPGPTEKSESVAPLSPASDPLATASPLENSDPEIDALELQIDREIDRLFVPLMEVPGSNLQSSETTAESLPPGATSVGSLASGHEEKAASASADAGEPLSPLKSASAAAEPESQKDIPDTARRTSPAEPAEELWRVQMSEHLEAFNAAFLSFDWEFSRKNLATLYSAVDALEAFCSPQNGSEILFKILRALLHRIQSRPKDITPLQMEMLRETHELLKIYLPAKGNVSPAERSRLKALVKKIGRDRQKERAAKGVETKAEVNDKGSKTADVFSRDPEVQEDLKLEDWRDLRECIEQSRSIAAGILLNFEEEKKKLDQIRSILEKSPALAPVAARVQGVCSGLAQQIAEYRKINGNWGAILHAAERLQKEQAGVCMQPSSEAVGLDTSSPSVDQEPARHEPETRRESVCVFGSNGERLAIPLSYLVKIGELSRRKSNRILGRGFASLSDFKPIFRNIGHGVIGKWGALPVDALKSFQFLPLSCDSFKIAPKADAALAVLVSSGQCHGVIFSESKEVLFINDAELTVEDNGGEVLGSIRDASMGQVSVLHLGHLLEKAAGLDSDRTDV